MNPIFAHLVTGTSACVTSCMVMWCLSDHPSKATEPPQAQTTALMPPPPTKEQVAATLHDVYADAVRHAMVQLKAGIVKVAPRTPARQRAWALEQDVASMERIDVDGCPIAFQRAFFELHDALGEAAAAYGRSELPVGQLVKDGVEAFLTDGMTSEKLAVDTVRALGSAEEVGRERALGKNSVLAALRRLGAAEAPYVGNL